MLTRSKTERERKASAPLPSDDSKDGGRGMSWLKIRTPNVRKRNSNVGLQKYERQGQQLLPGIPNEVTLDLIVPRLPWITFHTLSSVNSSWRQAIRSRQVYTARCRAQATETLIIISALRSVKDGEDYGPWIGLYSMTEGKMYRLPGIGLGRGIPQQCQCISLDGKVYVIGGLSSNFSSSRSVFVLDLVASKGWKRCASMKSARSTFGCCIVDGKIFVCGGFTGDDSRGITIREVEVYDPELDLWSSLKSMTSSRVGNDVAVLGDEILVYGGIVYEERKQFTRPPNFPEIYNPMLDEWRTVAEPMKSRLGFNGEIGMNWKILLFVIEGNLIHRIESTGAMLRDEVYNFEKRSWSSAPKSLLFDVPGKLVVDLAPPLVVENEIVRLLDGGLHSTNLTLIRSSGFRVGRKIRAWQTTKIPFCKADDSFLRPVMSIIRL